MLVEKTSSGHRLYYVGILAATALTSGDSVLLVLHSDEVEAPAVLTHLGPIRSKISIASTNDFSLDSIGNLSRKYGADLTLIPDGDSFALEIAKKCSWSGAGALTLLIMRERASRSLLPGLQRTKSFLKMVLLKRAEAVAGVRIVRLLSAIDSNSKVKSSIAAVADPVTMTADVGDSTRLRTKWGMNSEKYWFSVLGAITRRKNVSVVARALLRLRTPGVGLLIAGVCDPIVMSEVRPILSSLREAGVGVIVVNRLLTELELDAAVGASDCIVLAHSNEGPSGLFGKALATGTRIVAAGAISLRHDANRVPGLAHWSRLNDRSVASSMYSAHRLNRPIAQKLPDSVDFASMLLQ